VLLTITLKRPPATDLGYLLHKHPGRRAPQTFSLGFGLAHVFWPEVGDERATAALMVEVDPVGLVRRTGGRGDGFALYQYVNDRPYVASSFMSVAIGEVYGTALSGRSRERPDLVDERLPLEARIAVVPARDGDDALRAVFEPLGYAVEIDRPLLDPRFPEWGDSPDVTLCLRGEVRLRDLLAHLTVLIPVLDDAKHYFVGEDEIDKLLRRGEGWLQSHPAREMIARRYLRHRRTLVDDAVARLTELDDLPADAEAEEVPPQVVRLHDQRLAAAVEALRASGARRVLDLGCGEGRLLALLREIPQFTEIVGVDVSHQALERAARALGLDESGPARSERVKLLHGALTYRDPRLVGYDAAAAIEVIEHLDPWRIAAFARVVFGEARPGTVVVTTPNADYNVRFPDLDRGAFRHADHRFEWSRDEFRDWCDSVRAAWGYDVRIEPIGPPDPDAGAPSQMAVFTRVVRGGGAS
jgi:3' terminal RNA ribose 2'-O-methyltransferase Hen1